MFTLAMGITFAPVVFWPIAPGRDHRRQRCRALTGTGRNGHRELAATAKHLAQDNLVAWGWQPGISVYGIPREPVPLPKEDCNRIVIARANAGGWPD